MDEKQGRINALMQLLDNTDYKALKAFEGDIPDDWEEIKAKRKAWRKEINSLQ